MLKIISNVTFSPCLYIVSLSDRTKEEKHFTIFFFLLPRVMMIAANKCVMLSSRRERPTRLARVEVLTSCLDSIVVSFWALGGKMGGHNEREPSAFLFHF